MKKILVIGSEGMLGHVLVKSLKDHRFDVETADIAERRDTSRRDVSLSRHHKADITDSAGIAALLGSVKPDIVVNTAAYTDVDGCEENPEKAYLINAEGAKNIAEACKNMHAFMVHISTDYVFDGEKRDPYLENDEPDPLNIYGDSKLKGENFIQDVLKDHLIIRTSWLYGPGGKNFVDTIIDKARIEKTLKVVDDQIGSPTYTVDLANAIADVLACSVQRPPAGEAGAACSNDNVIAREPEGRPKQSQKAGLLRCARNDKGAILNITNSGACSWHEFAKKIIELKSIKGVEVLPAASEEIARLAKRPANSMLDNARYENLTKKKMPFWDDALARYLS